MPKQKVLHEKNNALISQKKRFRAVEILLKQTKRELSEIRKLETNVFKISKTAKEYDSLIITIATKSVMSDDINKMIFRNREFYYERDQKKKTTDKSKSKSESKSESESEERVSSYKCFRCGERNVVFYLRQLRSCDEGSTQIFNCRTCGNEWRKN